LELALSALSAMERLRCLGERRHCSRRDDGRERALQHRQHHGSGPCLGSGRKRGIHQRALGRSRGGFTSKIHCLGDARGRPIAFHLTPGEAADCKAYDTLIDLPEQPPDALLADKAYDTDAIRGDLKERGIKPVIPPKSNRTATIRYSKRLYRQRNCIERVLGHLKINRAVATRYDQLADSFLGMLFIASARYWIKFVHAA
jgi:transposase